MEGGESDAETVQEGTDSLGVLYSPGDRQAELQHGLRALYLRLQAELPCCFGGVPQICLAALQSGKTRSAGLCRQKKETVIPEAVSC